MQIINIFCRLLKPEMEGSRFVLAERAVLIEHLYDQIKMIRFNFTYLIRYLVQYRAW